MKRQKNRLNKLFLIGNGFDLAHGLQTGYCSFIVWYLKKCIKNAIQSGFYTDACLMVKINLGIFKEREIEISDYIDKAFDESTFWEWIVRHNRKDPAVLHHGDYIKIFALDDFNFNLLKNCTAKDWGGIEDEIYREIIKNHNLLSNERYKLLENRRDNSLYNRCLKAIKQLNNCIERIKLELIEYLKLNNDPSVARHYLLSNYNNDWGEELKKTVGYLREDERKVLFLNFNYTTYFSRKVLREFKYELRDELTTFETIYIHGHLEGDIENVVFGVGDESRELYADIESLYDDEWLQPLKSFHYLKNQEYQNLLGFIEDGDYEIYVIGHSCSITDRTLLNMIFEHDSCKKIHVYHYDGMTSYLRTAYNIARNFNNKVRLRRVLQPFNLKLSTK